VFDLAVVGASFVASVVTIFVVRALATRRKWLDHPNSRSAHAMPTARVGGVGVVVSFVAGSAFTLYHHGATGLATEATLMGIVAIAALGFADDVLRLRATVKLAIQIVIATTTVALIKHAGATPLLGDHGALGVVVAAAFVGWIVWLTNLYNFMDGIDGIAGGQSLIAASAIAVASFSAGSDSIAWVMVVLALSSLGFLVFNFPPASIFMGDVGSTAIGFAFGALPLLPASKNLSLWIWPLAISLFILDASVTLMRRIVRRENILSAHRSHFYQRPLALGVRHLPITLASYAGMVVVGAATAAFPILDRTPRIIAAILPLFVFGVLINCVWHLERKHGESKNAAVNAGS
jgi:UDP-N-acetylmuramyl pentapeptide phosphotransferase/UDP-N-acetylglucosamine-1-phosphate transferase